MVYGVKPTIRVKKIHVLSIRINPSRSDLIGLGLVRVDPVRVLYLPEWRWRWSKGHLSQSSNKGSMKTKGELLHILTDVGLMWFLEGFLTLYSSYLNIMHFIFLIWLIKIRGDVSQDFQITERTKICSLHFKESDAVPWSGASPRQNSSRKRILMHSSAEPIPSRNIDFEPASESDTDRQI